MKYAAENNDDIKRVCEAIEGWYLRLCLSEFRAEVGDLLNIDMFVEGSCLYAKHIKLMSEGT